jgi:ectoine hydroxylase-related dioxygenase (phytanoyl-CoA dioxygenase family)
MAADNEPHSLKVEMEEHGYVFIRGLIPVVDLQGLLSEITEIVYDAGWLLRDHSPLARLADARAACGAPDAQYKRAYQQVFNLESFHALAHHPALQKAMSLLVGPRLLIHPKPIGRLVFPNCEHFTVHEHQDFTAIGGDPETFTAWMPLHDCPAESGSLRILEGSHRFGHQKTGAGSGYIARGTELGGDWVGGQINAGDVLIFHSLTVHAATPNTSTQLRISVDCRFQDSTKPINPAELVFLGGSQSGRSWESTYANWRRDDLKYYWKRMPLKLKPSRVELEQLAHAAESEMMRERYAKILNALEAEMAGTSR